MRADLYPSDIVAKVRVGVDFPGAENVWVTVEPVYASGSISEALDSASRSVLDSLALDAGRSYAERQQLRDDVGVA